MNFLRQHFVAKHALDALKPLIFITNITGLMPFRITSEKGIFKSVIHIPYAFCLVILVCTYVICVLFSVFSGKTVVELLFDSPFFKSNEHIRVYIGLISMLCLILTIFKQKDNFKTKIELLTDIDCTLAQLGVSKKYTDLKIYHTFAVCLHQIVHTVHTSVNFIFFSHWNKKPCTTLVIATGAPTFTATVIAMIFVCIVRMASSNLRELNKELSKLTLKIQETKPCVKRELKTYTNSKIRDTFIADRLHVIMKAYDKTCDLSKNISDDFGLQILIIISVAFIFIVINMFFILSTVSLMNWNGDVSHKNVYFLLFSLYHFMIHATNVLAVAYVCNNFENEATESAVLISKMQLEENDETTVLKIQQFSLLLLHRKPNFTALGFFDVNHKLIYTMVGAATTYLIILADFYFTEVSFRINGIFDDNNNNNNNNITL